MAESNASTEILKGARLGITPTGWRNADFPELTAKTGGKQYYTARST